MNKSIRPLFAMLVAVTILGFSAAPALAWGDNGEGRPSYTTAKVVAGDLGDRVVFNSVSDGVIGDEKNFVGARLAGENKGAANVWCANEIEAEDGEIYLVRLYVHNDTPGTVAENTAVSISVPGDSATEHKVTGFISADNATPSEYWDSVSFVSRSAPFHLEYIAGSAYLENNGVGKDGLQLADDIVCGDISIGYDALDGQMPGGWECACYITIQLRVVYDYVFTVETRARGLGSDEWLESASAKAGDVVELIVYYKNDSDAVHEGVVLKAVLPEYMEYVPGSTYLYNANHPDGIVNNDDTITTHGINVGTYGPGTNAYAVFRARIADEGLDSGENVLVAWGQAGAKKVTEQSYTRIVVDVPSRFAPIKWALRGAIIALSCMLVVELFLFARFKRHIKREEESEK